VLGYEWELADAQHGKKHAEIAKGTVFSPLRLWSNVVVMKLNLWFHAKKFLPESFRLRSSASMSLSLKSAAQAGRS
jgi:hypothetical protein